MDETRAFYRRLGIREKPGPVPYSTVEKQLLHAEIIKNTLKTSRVDEKGLVDPSQIEGTSGGKLLKFIVEYLEDDPIYAGWYWI